MDENTPESNPLDDRLRATFQAEHADIERRIPPVSGASRWSRPSTLLPLAIAAAALVIAGFAFLGNSPSDEVVEVGVAQESESDAGLSEQDDTGETDPDNAATAIPLPVPTSAGPLPWLDGENFCGTEFDPGRTIVVGDGQADAPLSAEPVIGRDFPASRTLPVGTEVVLTGACTSGGAATPAGSPAPADPEIFTWYQVQVDATTQEWILVDFLMSPADAAGELAVGPDNNCGIDISPGERWVVFGIPADDPDGGLVAHTAPGVDEPVTRVIAADVIVELTGGCALSPNGTPWFELIDNEWVSSNFLRAVPPGLAEAIEGLTRPHETDSCGLDLEAGQTRFAWGITPDDPDAGLAFAGAGADSAVTRIIAMNEVVTLAGGCLLIDDAPWIALTSTDGSFDWVDTNFLIAPSPACLFGEAVPVGGSAEPLFGPLEGHAAILGDVTAFAELGATTYQFFSDASLIATNVPCFFEGSTNPICVNGTLTLIDPMEPEPVFSAVGPIDATRTGRLYLPLAQRGLAEEWIELVLSLIHI